MKLISLVVSIVTVAVFFATESLTSATSSAISSASTLRYPLEAGFNVTMDGTSFEGEGSLMVFLEQYDQKYSKASLPDAISERESDSFFVSAT